MRKFLIWFSCLFLALNYSMAQTVISQWNFNSNPPDASSSTGSTNVSAGTGTLSFIGGITQSFASGTSNGGSTDPAATDNTGLNVTTFPAQGQNQKTAGIQFNTSTVGMQNIQVYYDLRHSNTSARHTTLQYTTDISASTPVWTDFRTDSTLTGDSWNNRSFDLSAITALNNNANVAFRVVTSFRPNSSIYSSANGTSTYASTGTLRFDMLTVSGTSSSPTDIIPPIAQTFKATSNTTSFIKFSEAVTSVSANNIANYSFSPSLTINSATLNVSGDTVFLNHAALVNGTNYTLTVSGIEDAAANVMTTANFPILINTLLPNLVITEIAHTPNDYEYFELFNNGSVAVNLNGLIITNGVSGSLPNIVLAPQTAIVLSSNSGQATTAFGFTVYPFSSGLSSSSDQVVIRNTLNQVIDSVAYTITAPWPASSAPSGFTGVSIELIDPSFDNNLGANWVLSTNNITTSLGTFIGTPGVYPPLPPGPAPTANVYNLVSATSSYVVFSTALNSASATNLANYSFAPALTINSATLGVNSDTVFLSHNAFANGVNYTLTVSGVQSSGNVPMSAAANFNKVWNSLTSGLVITEVIHSPNTIEMIEVYNASSNTINVNGLKWIDGTTGNFPDTTIAAGDVILFSTVPTTASSLLGGQRYFLINNGLGSSSDRLIITNTLNQIVDSVEYFVGTNGWPAAPSNVYGYSFELTDAALANNAGANWTVPQNIVTTSNGTVLATPGIYPPPPVSPAPTILSYKQLSATQTLIRFNQTVTSASANDTANYDFSPLLGITSAVLGVNGDSVIVNHNALVDGQAYVLTVSGVQNNSAISNTVGILNLIWNQSIPQLVITEIIHSPNTIEMIEVYNAGATAVNLGGLIWTDGTSGNFPSVSLAAGQTAVFATDPINASLILNYSPIYTINNGLGSSNDILVIRNSVNQVIDSVAYFIGTNGWPTAPLNVYGYSFELVSASSDNNLGSNWIAPLNPVTPQPTQGIVTATPGVYPTPPYTPTNASVAFVGSRVNTNETNTDVKIIAVLNGGGSNASSIQLEVLPISTATAGTDFTVPTNMTFEWAASSNGVNDTLVFTLNNDVLPENTEYFIVRMVNPVNIDLPAAAINHFTVFIADDDMQAPTATQEIELNHLNSFSNGAAGTNSAEIVTHDPASQRLFIANSIGGKIDIVNFSNPAAPVLINSITMAPYGGINSVAVKNGIVAAAVENAVPELPGKVVFFDINGTFLNQVTVGAMPDMITFNNAGTKVLTPNEGQPSADYTVDPEGSISIIDISGGIANLTQANVSTASFASFNSQIAALRTSGVRIFGPNATVAQDMEPEYITLSDDDQTAYVTCQENNALAIVNMATSTVSQILPLGYKDHMMSANALDASDQGGVIQIANWPVKGVYMPDAIASFNVGGQTYLITANEGDAREYNAYEEAARVSSSTYVLDTIAFPYAAAIKANLGRLNITTASGDTDGDGDFDEIHAFGARSVSIWNATTGALVWDSGDDFELITSKHPTLSAIFNASNSNNTFKNRSDDKGPEPEGVATAVINGKVYAFIALERIGGCMVYDITNPAAPVFVDYKNTRTIASYGGDQGAEGIIYIEAANSPNGRPIVILANEVSSTLAIYELQGGNTTLQILHGSDFEAGLSAINDAPNFAAIVDTLEHTYANTLILSSGDNMLPSPFSSSGEDPSLVTPLKNAYISYYGSNFVNNDLRAGIARPDISIMNFIGVEAAALGNHEFDWGTSELRNMIAGGNSGTAIRWFGAQFPYLSANLDFSNDANLSNIFEATRKPNTFFKSNPTQTAAQIAATKKLAKSTIISKNGQEYGIVGATTPQLAQISSPGATSILNPGAGTNNMQQLASIIQPVVDSLRFKEGINKIILLAHMQQLSLEQQLATYLRGVDVIVAGGSHTLLADNTDRMRAGDTPQGNYPIFTTDADGKPVAIVNTTSEYKYVGRLVIDFDLAGNIIPTSVDTNISGAYAADSIGVTALWGNYNNAFATGTKGQLVKSLTTAIGNVIASKDGNIFGKTAVFLEGRRNSVRTEETNLGNLSSDANLWVAKQVDPTVKVSIKNGGGIRAQIGEVLAVGNNVVYTPPTANPSAGKQAGDVSQLDIENALRFNNRLSILSLTAANLKAILEHGVAQTAPGATPGRFPQVGGVQFSFDATLAVNSRIRNAVIADENGNYTDTIVQNGAVYGNPARTFKIVTLNFLAGGGDGYPFNTLGTGRYDLDTVLVNTPGAATFTVPGSEQDAFAEYMLAFHTVNAYNKRDTAMIGDVRIQNISARPDCILSPVLAAKVIGDTSVCSGSTINISAFPANGTYLWNTNATTETISVNQTGSFSANVSLNGCNGKTDTLSVALKALPTVVANTTSNTVCVGSNVTLTGSGATSYSWNNGVTNGTAFAPASTTTYTVTGTDANNCSNTAQVTVTVNALPTVVANTTSNAVCAGSNVTLTGSGATSYSWNNGVTNGTAFAPANTTTYTVTGTDANNCSNTAQVIVTVNALPTVVANTTSNAVCAGSNVTLTGSGATSYSWNNGVTNGTAFAPANTTTYTVTGTDANNCSNTAQVTVTVNALPIVVANTSALAICSGDDVTLSGSGANTYNWSNGVIDATAFTPATTQTYTVIGTDINNCVDSATITVVVNANPTVSLGANIKSCNAPVSLNAGAGFINYNWSNGSNTQQITVTATGNYSVIVGDVNGCLGYDTIAVTVVNTPNLNLGPDQVICVNNDLTLIANTGFQSYSWSSSTETGNTAVYTNLGIGTYTFACTGVINGCFVSDVVNITVDPCLSVEENNTVANIKLYPNPSQGNVKIELPISWIGNTSLVVMDMNGKVVSTQMNIDNAITELEMQNQPNGMYFIQLINNNQVQTLKLIKQ